MLDCRYYDLCCFTDDSCNGEPECPKRGHCQFYSPMPDVKALAGLADEMDEVAQRRRSMGYEGFAIGDEDRAYRIREALEPTDD